MLPPLLLPSPAVSPLLDVGVVLVAAALALELAAALPELELELELGLEEPELEPEPEPTDWACSRLVLMKSGPPRCILPPLRRFLGG